MVWLFAGQYARRKGLTRVEWIVHAVHCAQPNEQLRRLLERRGYTIQDVPGIGRAYYFCQLVSR